MEHNEDASFERDCSSPDCDGERGECLPAEHENKRPWECSLQTGDSIWSLNGQ